VERPGTQVDDPDAGLIAGIARGDAESTRVFVARHLNRLLGLAFRLLGNRADAEEVVQDVFMRVWEHAARWEPGRARFDSWMYRVTVNLCYDRLRRRREVPSDELAEMADERPNPAQQLHAAQVADKVRDALSRLPDRQQTAIVLCHHQGMSNIETAEIMGLSVEAVESLLSRGRRKLRTLMKSDAHELMEGL
jgi:RNA polymerase sigma-70 factor, ECF subfamily